MLFRACGWVRHRRAPARNRRYSTFRLWSRADTTASHDTDSPPSAPDSAASWSVAGHLNHDLRDQRSRRSPSRSSGLTWSRSRRSATGAVAILRRQPAQAGRCQI